MLDTTDEIENNSEHFETADISETSYPFEKKDSVFDNLRYRFAKVEIDKREYKKIRFNRILENHLLNSFDVVFPEMYIGNFTTVKLHL